MVQEWKASAEAPRRIELVREAQRLLLAVLVLYAVLVRGGACALGYRLAGENAALRTLTGFSESATPLLRTAVLLTSVLVTLVALAKCLRFGTLAQRGVFLLAASAVLSSLLEFRPGDKTTCALLAAVIGGALVLTLLLAGELPLFLALFGTLSGQSWIELCRRAPGGAAHRILDPWTEALVLGGLLVLSLFGKERLRSRLGLAIVVAAAFVALGMAYPNAVRHALVHMLGLARASLPELMVVGAIGMTFGGWIAARVFGTSAAVTLPLLAFALAARSPDPELVPVPIAATLITLAAQLPQRSTGSSR